MIAALGILAFLFICVLVLAFTMIKMLDGIADRDD